MHFPSFPDIPHDSCNILPNRINLYTRDMIIHLIQLALYADDTALLTQPWRTDTIVRRLTHAMTVLHRYFTKWKLQVNINKTVAILFTKSRPPPPVTMFSSHRNPLEPTHQVPGP
jgi:hypothetical protein